jgi:hypothetical protein
MIHLTLFTGIQYIKFTAVGERAVHITITKKICRNFVVMQRTLSIIVRVSQFVNAKQTFPFHDCNKISYSTVR